jgi:hypothetical protein
MKTRTALLAVFALFGVCSAVHALYSVSYEGTWPKSWPKELEPLRKQARTLEGPLAPNLHYAIRFNKREEFESAWPHIVELKSKGAPIILKRGPNFFLGGNSKAGVVVHCPPAGNKNPEAPMNTTYIELVVDGDIVDLNRIRLPADTVIIDQRFDEGKAK